MESSYSEESVRKALVRMLASLVPMVLLVLLGLGGFAAGFWLRRRPTPPVELAVPLDPPALVLSHSPVTPAPTPAPVAPEAAATLAVASRAILYRNGLPYCPTCGERMVLREYKEQRIWVCDEFPVCRGAAMVQ